MKRVRVVLTVLSLLVVTSVFAQSQMSKVKTVWVIMMENHNYRALQRLKRDFS
jgi:hypothetical protein